MDERKKPLGLLILANLNLIFFGAISFLVFYYLYINITGPEAESFMEEFRKFLPTRELTTEQFKAAVVSQIIISLIFILSGAGLVMVKEWARKLTIYFCFFMVALVFISTILNPQLIGQAIFQIIYPGVLILYFTNKKVENFFIPENSSEEAKEEQK